MKTIYLQRALAVIFASLGSWCIISPSSVERLVFRPEFHVGNSTSELLIGCFGAQAVLVAVIVWNSVFRPSTFLVFGIVGSLPFFAFNYYFYFEAEMFTEWMLLDFVGNVGILTTCLLGYRAAKAELRAQIKPHSPPNS
jgi:hypothetical protein